MQHRIKVAAVSYLNTKPLLFGIENSALKNEIDLVIDYPSTIARMLLKNETDAALVPVSILPELSDGEIISDFGIACDGRVSSVCIFSQKPLQEVQRLYLDYQSRTSVALTRWLCEDYWKIHPTLLSSRPGYENMLNENDAALIIGDRALQQKKNFRFEYDLGEAWKNFTGLPFIFAAWIANKKLPASFISVFNQAQEEGLKRLDEVIKMQQPFYPGVNVKQYLTNNIKSFFTAEMKRGMNLFLQHLQHKSVTIVTT